MLSKDIETKASTLVFIQFYDLDFTYLIRSSLRTSSFFQYLTKILLRKDRSQVLHCPSKIDGTVANSCFSETFTGMDFQSSCKKLVKSEMANSLAL